MKFGIAFCLLIIGLVTLCMTGATGDKMIDSCMADVLQCPDGSLVSRDPLNHCNFKECPAGDVKSQSTANATAADSQTSADEEGPSSLHEDSSLSGEPASALDASKQAKSSGSEASGSTDGSSSSGAPVSVSEVSDASKKESATENESSGSSDSSSSGSGSDAGTMSLKAAEKSEKTSDVTNSDSAAAHSISKSSSEPVDAPANASIIHESDWAPVDAEDAMFSALLPKIKEISFSNWMNPASCSSFSSTLERAFSRQMGESQLHEIIYNITCEGVETTPFEGEFVVRVESKAKDSTMTLISCFRSVGQQKEQKLENWLLVDNDMQSCETPNQRAGLEKEILDHLDVKSSEKNSEKSPEKMAEKKKDKVDMKMILFFGIAGLAFAFVMIVVTILLSKRVKAESQKSILNDESSDLEAGNMEDERDAQAVDEDEADSDHSATEESPSKDASQV